MNLKYKIDYLSTYCICTLILIPSFVCAEESLKPDAQVLSISLVDSIKLSLSQNPDITVLSLNPRDVSQDILEAEGSLDFQLGMQTNMGESVSPSSSSLSGNSFSQTERKVNMQLDKVFSIGTEISIAWENSRRANDALFTTLNPEWNTRAQLRLTQPLLRGWGDGSPEIKIKLARKLHKAAVLNYKASLSSEVLQIVRNYWNVSLALKTKRVKLKNMKLAKKLREDAKIAVSLGVLAPIAISKASATLALRKEELLLAESVYVKSESQLLKTLGLDVSNFRVPNVEIKDKAAYFLVDFNINESLEVALKERAEIATQKMRIKSALLSRRIAANRMLPEINFVGSAGVQGLAGKFQASSFGEEQSSPFEGDYGDAFGSLSSGDYYNFSAGIEVKHTFGNRSAKASRNRSDIALLRAKQVLASWRQKISTEVKDAIEDLRASVGRIKAAEEATGFAAKSLQTGQERFKAGVTTTREILELQNDQAEAELALAKALVDFQIAVAGVSYSRGELLQKYDIELLE